MTHCIFECLENKKEFIGTIPVGFFQDAVDRDYAFEMFFLKSKRNGYKGEFKNE